MVAVATVITGARLGRHSICFPWTDFHKGVQFKIF